MEADAVLRPSGVEDSDRVAVGYSDDPPPDDVRARARGERAE